MTKKELITKILNHERRGEDTLWLAETYRKDVCHGDIELDQAVCMLLDGAERFSSRLAELDKELELNILGN